MRLEASVEAGRAGRRTCSARCSVLLGLLVLAGCGEDTDVGAAELSFDGGRLDAVVESPSAGETGRGADSDTSAIGGSGETDGETGSGSTFDPRLGPRGLYADSPGARVGGGAPVPGTPGDGDPLAGWPRGEGGLPVVTWDGMLLPDARVDDLLDSLIYPDEYTEEERTFPAELSALNGREVELHGYMIPLEWEGEKVRELMLVGDVLACCFGGAPEPDQWVDVLMVGEGAEYYMQLPIVCRGTFQIEGIADEAGYAAGCYVLKCTSLELAD